MTTTVTAAEAEAHIRDLLARVEDGDEVIIARDGHPIARLVPDASAQGAADDDEFVTVYYAGQPIRRFKPRGEHERGSSRAKHLGWAREIYGPLNDDWDEPMTEEELGEFYDGPIFPQETSES